MPAAAEGQAPAANVGSRAERGTLFCGRLEFIVRIHLAPEKLEKDRLDVIHIAQENAVGTRFIEEGFGDLSEGLACGPQLVQAAVGQEIIDRPD